MCKCVQKEKIDLGLGNYDYVFTCRKTDNSPKVITIRATNDSQAKHLAEKKCQES